MNMPISAADFLDFGQRVAPAYVRAFDQAQEVLDAYGITTSVLRLAHFTAQILEESAALSCEVENLDYHAERLREVFPHWFDPAIALHPHDPLAYAGAPEKLANLVYGDRMGNSAPGDGYIYRGRGLLQLTGKDGYLRARQALAGGDLAPPNLVTQPELALAPKWILRIAAAVWVDKGCNRYADNNDIERVTRAINGGVNGLAQRKAWFKQAYARFTQLA